MLISPPKTVVIATLKTVMPYVLVAFASIVISTLLARKCSHVADNPDYLEEARNQILESVRKEREANDLRIQMLEEGFNQLQFQVDIIDSEIMESAEEREEIHDAINNASSIDDIDRILKRGIPYRTGGRKGN